MRHKRWRDLRAETKGLDEKRIAGIRTELEGQHQAAQDATLSKLWQQHKPDYNEWTYESLNYLTDTDPHKLASSRLLYGSPTDKEKNAHRGFELYLGSLLAISTNVVFFRASPNWQIYSGLVRRFTTNLRFSLYSITDETAQLVIEDRDVGRATIKHSSGGWKTGGGSTETIDPVRWSELRPWLEYWLPYND